MSEKPLNLIVLTSDEMRGDCAGFMGNPDVQTPNLDRFAGGAVVLEKHFTVHGKCVPSRIAMMTGRYPHTDGIRTVNETNLLPPGAPNLLLALKNRGYETAYFGHNHVFEDFWGTNEKSSGIVDYHSYTNECFRPLLDKKWPVRQPDSNSLPTRYSDETINLEVERMTEPLAGFCDDNRAEQAIHFLKTIRDKSRPFYLHLNFGKPHPAYKIEEPYFSMYDRDKIKPFEFGLPENAPLHLVKQREIRSGPAAAEADFRQLQAVYYAMITKMDLLFGRVMAAIEAEGLLENSVILFWVDHGDFAGQYGLPEKWDTAMQDCILHVPQIIYAPGLPRGKRMDSLTEHTDIAPTALELLGVKPEPQWVIHGESLLPIIRGEKRKEVVFADGGHEEAMRRRFNRPIRQKDKKGRDAPSTQGKQETYGRFPGTMARCMMARTEKWKLVIRETGGNELYNMEADPNEMNNLYGQPQYNGIVQDLQLKLLEWRLRTDTDHPFQEDVGA